MGSKKHGKSKPSGSKPSGSKPSKSVVAQKLIGDHKSLQEELRQQQLRATEAQASFNEASGMAHALEERLSDLQDEIALMSSSSHSARQARGRVEVPDDPAQNLYQREQEKEHFKREIKELPASIKKFRDQAAAMESVVLDCEEHIGRLNAMIAEVEARDDPVWDAVDPHGSEDPFEGADLRGGGDPYSGADPYGGEPYGGEPYGGGDEPYGGAGPSNYWQHF